MTECDDVVQQTQLKCDTMCQRELKDIWDTSRIYKNGEYHHDYDSAWQKDYRGILNIQSGNRRKIKSLSQELQDAIQLYDKHKITMGQIMYGDVASNNQQLLFIENFSERIKFITGSIGKCKNRLKWFASDEMVVAQCESWNDEPKICPSDATGKFDYKQIGKYRIDSLDFDFWLRNPKSDEQLCHKLQLGDQQIDYSPTINSITEKRIYHTFETYYARKLLLNWWLNTGHKLRGIGDENAQIDPAYSAKSDDLWESHSNKIHMDNDYIGPMRDMFGEYKRRVFWTDMYIQKFGKSNTYSSVLLAREIENSGVLKDLLKRTETSPANIISPENKKSGFFSWFGLY